MLIFSSYEFNLSTSLLHFSTLVGSLVPFNTTNIRLYPIGCIYR
nr:MAG TPA: hypothetical protein [Caudoviricetes sp.]